MLSTLKMPRWLVWALCVAIFAIRVSGAHLHLCFDGQQPQASVQSGQPGVDVLHQDERDTDISVDGDALVKSLDNALAQPTLLVAAILLSILSTLRGAGFAFNIDLRVFPQSHGHYLRPPLRGPPR